MASTSPPLLLQQAPRRILVVTMRYLGDALLVTPLLNSLQAAYQHAEIDVLTFPDVASIFEGNPAIARVITVARKPTWRAQRELLGRIFRHYDLAISTQAGDRPTLYSVLAAKVRIGLVPPKPQTGWFKRYLMTRSLEFDVHNTHTVLEILRLCQLLPIEPRYQLTAPVAAVFDVRQIISAQRYVVLHVMPQWRYKQWTFEGWAAVAHYLHSQGFTIVLSGSQKTEELAYLAQLMPLLPSDTLNLAGQLSLAELAKVIAGATLYIGIDTGITHLAAATGVKIIALFGPSDPVKWAPWPVAYQSQQAPFVSKGNQRVNNVILVQGPQDCVPCYLEGCERHQQSYSACLEAIKPEQVINAITELLPT